MPYVYVNPRIDESSMTPYTNAAYNNATHCTWSKVFVGDVIMNVVNKKYEATRARWVSTSDPQVQPGVRPHNYFGNMADPSFLPFIPKPVSFEMDPWVERGELPLKVFRELQRAGKIVLQRYAQVNRKVTLYPGLQRDNLGTPTLVRIAKQQHGDPAFPVGYSVPCGGRAGVQWDLPDGVAIDDSKTPGALSNIFCTYDRYHFANAASAVWVTPRREVGSALGRLVGKAFSEEPLQGLVTEVLAEANSGTFDLLTNLAELRGSVSTALGLCIEVLKLYSETRKDIYKARKRASQLGSAITSEIASRWMEFRYGVMPIVYSIQDILKYLEDNGMEFQTTRKGRGPEDLDIEFDGWTGTANTGIRRCYLKRRFDLKVLSSNFMKMNVMSTAWELVPLSFVIDWVLNVGDFLSALQAPRGVAEQGMFYSVQLNGEFVFTHPDFPGGSIVIETSGYRGYPINPLANIGLTVDPSMSWKRWVDALALLWGSAKTLR